MSPIRPKFNVFNSDGINERDNGDCRWFLGTHRALTILHSGTVKRHDNIQSIKELRLVDIE